MGKKAKPKSAEPTPPNNIGAPRVEIDLEQLGALCRMKPTLRDAALFFKCSEDTIERRVREGTIAEQYPEGMTFAEFRDQNFAHTRFDLIRKAIKKAATDTQMHKFVLKNLADWVDRVDMTSGGKEMPPAQVIITLPRNGREGKK